MASIGNIEGMKNHPETRYKAVQRTLKKRPGRLAIFVILFLLVTTCKKEIRLQQFPEFGRVYHLEGNQHLTGVIKTPEDGYLAYGYTDGNTNDRQDGFLMMLDKNYNPLWFKTYGGFGEDYLTSACFDNVGNILTGGKSYSFGASIDSNSTTPNSCIYALYLTKNGDIIWEKTYRGNASGTNNYNELCKTLFLSNNTFALVGSTTNFLQQFGGNLYYNTNAYIQCIDKQGQEIWNSNYNFYDSLIPFPDYPAAYWAGNAVQSKDGNIIMLMTAWHPLQFPVTLYKIPANASSGSNVSLWRKSVTGYIYAGTYRAHNDLFCPMQLADSIAENYLLALESDLILFDKYGTVLSKTRIADGLIEAMTVKNGYAFTATRNELIKTELNGTVLWRHKIIDFENLGKVAGIFVQDDGQISVFSDHADALGDRDLVLFKLDKNGQIILE